MHAMTHRQGQQAAANAPSLNPGPKHIRLTYALAEGPAIRLDGIWTSTSEAIAWACGQGAIVAAARALP